MSKITQKTVSRFMELAKLDGFKQKFLKESFEQPEESGNDMQLLNDDETSEFDPELPETDLDQDEDFDKTVPKDEIDVGSLIKNVTDRIANVLNSQFGEGTVDADVSEETEAPMTESKKIEKRIANKILSEMKKNKLFLSKGRKNGKK